MVETPTKSRGIYHLSTGDERISRAKKHRKTGHIWTSFTSKGSNKITGVNHPYWGYSKVIPSGYVKIAIENGHRNSGFSH